jgi:glycosyltransferase involved in cell wall biosynthesis
MSDRLKIAMISYYLPSGSKIGVGYQVHALANQLVRNGHEVTVFSACTASDGALYHTHTVPLTGRNRTFRFALALRRQAWTEFDVLHAHGDDYWLGGRERPTHIRTMHGSCFEEALHIEGAQERLRMVLLGLSEILATCVADRTVLVSRSTRKWLPWVRAVIPNGVDLSRFRPGVRSPNPSILFVGTYLRRKRGGFLADTFESEVLPATPDAELWMVCGDAPPRRGAKVLGRVSDQELAELYGSAWLFCLPSTYEGFGIPYIEAMASGCPVVATPNLGAIEVTRGGVDGLVVADGELGATLNRLLGSAHEREQLAQRGLQASREFSLADIAQRYEQIYRSTRPHRRRRAAARVGG